MARFGFTTSGSYTSQSPNAAADVMMNFYNETNEDPNGKSPMSFYHTPGLKTAYSLSGPSVRGIFTFNGRTFAVSGPNFYEIFADGTFKTYGPIAVDLLPASITAGLNQILLASAGVLYVFDLTANTLTPVNMTTLVGPVSQVAYVDGFFIALFKNSGEFQVSTPDDATSWDLTNVAIVSVFPDNVVSMLTAYREIFFFSSKQTVAYFDSGNLFPFDVVQGGFVEQGCIATFSPAKVDNSVFWIGGDERGAGIVWRARGYTPERISTHAVEFAMQNYPTISDAIGYAYQDQGHTFYVLYFPTANHTWVYDAATGLWHERSFLFNGTQIAHRSQCHCDVTALNRHLVGDWNSGNIYQMSVNFYTDFGNPIQRIRQAPHVSTENQWLFHNLMVLDVETGLGPQPPLLDGNGEPREPQVILQWSDDGGHSWSNEHPRGAGFAGDFTKRVKWNRLGRSRDRVYKLKVTDPIPWRIIDSYLFATPGFASSERLASELRKVG